MVRKVVGLPAFQLACRNCNIIFFLCQSCWRGQAYCSKDCSKIGRKRTVRKAQKRLLETSQGKEKNRLRQRNFRNRSHPQKRQILPTVTHQTTKVLPSIVSTQKQKPNEVQCLNCGSRVRFCFSLELGRSLRSLAKKNFKGKHDTHRNMGRGPPIILR